MKVGIDINQVVYQGTGVGRFTQNLVESVLSYDQKNQYIFFFSSLRQKLDDRLEQKIKTSNQKLIKWRFPPSLLSLLWNDLHQFSSLTTNYLLPTTTLDYFISSDWTEPPLNCPKATIVHDLIYRRYPETLDKKIVFTQEKRMNWVKQESKIIFADSLSTKDDLIKLLNIDSKKIAVNYPGVTIIQPTKQQIMQTLKKYGIKKPFILTVGKLEPRKNITRLIQSFNQLNDNKIDLIIAGPKGWDSSLNIKHQTLNIKYLGHISDIELYSLYSSCLFFVYPSLYEGFGYPIVEAMKLGAPVACSNTSSMKEIAGDAALLFNPLKINEIFHCIVTMKQDKKLRDELISKGKERAKMFNWEKYINKMLFVLNNLTNKPI